MTYFLNTVFNAGDEVYVGMKNTVYKAKIQSIEVHGFLHKDTIIQPRVTYYLDKPGHGSSVNEVAVFATEEEAKLRQKILQEANIAHFELYYRLYMKDGEVMMKKHEPFSLATDFISLVKRMRNMQETVEFEAGNHYDSNDPCITFCLTKHYRDIRKMKRLESEVDEYLKKMEDLK